MHPLRNCFFSIDLFKKPIERGELKTFSVQVLEHIRIDKEEKHHVTEKLQFVSGYIKSIILPFILLLIGLLYSLTALPDPPRLNKIQIESFLKKVKSNQKLPHQKEIIQTLEASIDWLDATEISAKEAKKYQIVINNFESLIKNLQKQIEKEDEKPLSIEANLTIQELEQEVIKTNSQLIELTRQIQHEQEEFQQIFDLILKIPAEQSEIRRILSQITQQLQLKSNPLTSLEQAQLTLLKAEALAHRAKLNQLELAQLSSNNRQELSRMRIELYQKRHEHKDKLLEILQKNLNDQRYKNAEQALKRTELMAKECADLPVSISKNMETNRMLTDTLNEQAKRMNAISYQKRQIDSEILKVKQTLNAIREQVQWLSVSPALGETLIAQVEKLPEKPKLQKLDQDMADLRLKRLNYEELLEQERKKMISIQEGGPSLASQQRCIFDAQMRHKSELLNLLISGYDSQILELTKIRLASNQLVDALNEVQEAVHRYLFWVPDINRVSFAYPIKTVKDLMQLLSLNTASQISGALMTMLNNQQTLLQTIGALLLVAFSIGSRRPYYAFLERTHNRVGKVNQDQFSLTLRTVFWSIFIASPLPILWKIMGYGLQNAWSYPIAVSIGTAVTETVPVLWVFMISATFASPYGLFISHFRWHPDQVKRAMRFYRMLIWLIVPLMMAIITFQNYNDREFLSTLGRLCFILLCIALSLVTTSLKRAGVPLYLDKNGHCDNVLNHTLWRLLFFAPLIAAFASTLGYLATAQALLSRLETSVTIWFFLLIVYHIIRRWMLIQRRRIAFERAKQRRADILAQRARGEEENLYNNSESAIEIEEPVINLDLISAQSLRLVRFILTMIALISVITIWSDIHSAFGFLENIHLWKVASTINGVDNIQNITMGSLLVCIFFIIVTAQLVRNLPALLELVLLQHLDLTPGTGYAISTITKYLIMLSGGMIGFSFLGIEWGKLQWMAAALTVGLGFGLQEIFANFISGLIILFEKPIRIGDTVTIRNFTGTVTKINTRATTIFDWDKKEVIVPNKAFVTEQFVNWSLSDTITRVVLNIPAPANVNSQLIKSILLNACKCCPLSLTHPEPEAYLINLEQGIQIFELRVFASDITERMPLRHAIHQLILEGYQQHGIDLPFPPFQAKIDTFKHDEHAVFLNKNHIRKTGSL